MNTFLSTTGKGIARAACAPDGQWTVEQVLEDDAVGQRDAGADALEHGAVDVVTDPRGELVERREPG